MLGAGIGAAIAAVAGGPIGLAAAIGGATGAIGSAATPPHGVISAHRRFATEKFAGSSTRGDEDGFEL